MSKLLGGIFVLIGFAVLIVNLVFKSWLDKTIPSIASLGVIVLGIAAVILIIIGLLFFRGSGNSNKMPPQAAEEVPIYHGEGKNRKIVGYRKESK